MWRIAGPFLAALIFPGLLSAQLRQVSQVGSRVRLTVGAASGADSISTTLKPRLITGDLASVEGDSVFLVRGREELPTILALESIRGLEVSRGHRSHAGRGALVGFMAGAVAGVATGYWICRGCEAEGVTGLVALAVGGLGALAGTGVGAVVGALARTERWEARPLTDLHVDMSLSPSSGSLAGSVRMRIPLPD